jgi:hypothetical protein
MKLIKNLFLTGLAAIAIAACTSQPKEAAIEVTVDSLLADASALEGKTVKFTATVDHACMHGGKRLTVFGSVEGKTMKVEGSDAVQKFESSLMGKQVEVIGVVKKVPGSVVADCETEEGKEVPTFAYVIECLNYKAI